MSEHSCLRRAHASIGSQGSPLASLETCFPVFPFWVPFEGGRGLVLTSCPNMQGQRQPFCERAQEPRWAFGQGERDAWVSSMELSRHGNKPSNSPRAKQVWRCLEGLGLGRADLHVTMRSACNFSAPESWKPTFMYDGQISAATGSNIELR